MRRREEHVVSLQTLTSGAEESEPAAVLKIERLAGYSKEPRLLKRLLFGAPEALQRFLGEQGLKLRGLEALLFCHLRATATAGLPGTLLAANTCGLAKLHVVGPAGTLAFARAAIKITGRRYPTIETCEVRERTAVWSNEWCEVEALPLLPMQEVAFVVRFREHAALTLLALGVSDVGGLPSYAAWLDERVREAGRRVLVLLLVAPEVARRDEFRQWMAEREELAKNVEKPGVEAVRGEDRGDEVAETRDGDCGDDEDDDDEDDDDEDDDDEDDDDDDDDDDEDDDDEDDDDEEDDDEDDDDGDDDDEYDDHYEKRETVEDALDDGQGDAQDKNREAAEVDPAYDEEEESKKEDEDGEGHNSGDGSFDEEDTHCEPNAVDITYLVVGCGAGAAITNRKSAENAAKLAVVCPQLLYPEWLAQHFILKRAGVSEFVRRTYAKFRSEPGSLNKRHKLATREEIESWLTLGRKRFDSAPLGGRIHIRLEPLQTVLLSPSPLFGMDRAVDPLRDPGFEEAARRMLRRIYEHGVQRLHLNILDQDFGAEHIEESPVGTEARRSELESHESMSRSRSPSMQVSLTFLGTGSAAPSNLRSSSGILLRADHSEHSFTCLLDAGEGTLRQLYRFHQGRNGDQSFEALLLKIDIIWISHKHLDHHGGLFRIAQAYQHARNKHEESVLRGCRDRPLLIVAPRAVLGHLRACLRASHQRFDVRLTTPSALNMGVQAPADEYDTPVKVESLSQLVKGLVSFPVLHCPDAYGMKLELGTLECSEFSLVYSGDTTPSPVLRSYAKGATVLIHEATFDDSFADQAIRKRHSTAGQAVEIGRDAGTDFLILTHFSQRYPKMPALTQDQRKRVIVAHDGLSVHFAAFGDKGTQLVSSSGGPLPFELVGAVNNLLQSVEAKLDE